MSEITREEALEALEDTTSHVEDDWWKLADENKEKVRAYINQLEARVGVLEENLSEATQLIENVEASYGWFALTRKFKSALAGKAAP